MAKSCDKSTFKTVVERLCDELNADRCKNKEYIFELFGYDPEGCALYIRHKKHSPHDRYYNLAYDYVKDSSISDKQKKDFINAIFKLGISETSIDSISKNIAKISTTSYELYLNALDMIGYSGNISIQQATNTCTGGNPKTINCESFARNLELFFDYCITHDNSISLYNISMLGTEEIKYIFDNYHDIIKELYKNDNIIGKIGFDIKYMDERIKSVLMDLDIKYDLELVFNIRSYSWYFHKNTIRRVNKLEDMMVNIENKLDIILKQLEE